MTTNVSGVMCSFSVKFIWKSTASEVKSLSTELPSPLDLMKVEIRSSNRFNFFQLFPKWNHWFLSAGMPFEVNFLCLWCEDNRRDLCGTSTQISSVSCDPVCQLWQPPCCFVCSCFAPHCICSKCICINTHTHTHTHAISPPSLINEDTFPFEGCDGCMETLKHSQKCSKSFLFVNAEGEFATAPSQAHRVGRLKNKKAV